MREIDVQEWPELPYAAWKDTCAMVQLWTQIVGKTRVALTPWLNHSWHVTLQVTARGLTTPVISAPECDFDIAFDFIDHDLWMRASDGNRRRVKLRAIPVAEFYGEFRHALDELGIRVRIDRLPNELPDATPFDEDRTHRAYDPDFANRFWRVLLRSHDVFSRFRTAFLGKASPVHFFWGSFDLAVTRFSGRRAPLHPGSIPHLPDAVVREAYSHEVSSAGFWPGGGAIEFPANYSYAYPAPDGFAAAPVRPSQAFFSRELGEFLLPYEAVRTSPHPEEDLLEFLESTYAAAADLGKWDREALECRLGQARVPRRVNA
jgi:hypothetical protein